MTETFVALDPKSAYEQAINKYGTGIKLLSAKQVKDEDGKLWAELSVSIPDGHVQEELKEENPVEEAGQRERTQEEHAEEARSEEAKVQDEPTVIETSAEEVDSEDETALLEELAALKLQLAQMKEDLLPQESVASKVKTLFMEKGIAAKWLDKVLASLMGNSILTDEKLLLSYILEEIDESLDVQEESLDEQKIIMLVGPTGVGKTTTIAKLAARYAYMMDRPYKVGFLNLDSFKVGAFDQLGHYADIMQLEHVTIDSLSAFIKGLEQLSDYDIILVDTAGMSPYDTQKFIKTIEFVQSDVVKKLEVNLLLAATVKYEDMDDIYKNFSFLNLHSVIISKFDETRHLGSLLNFMLLYQVPMSYFCVGQEVPDDLLLASKEYLLERFIGDLDG